MLFAGNLGSFLGHPVARASEPSTPQPAENKPAEALRARLDRRLDGEINFDPNTPLKEALSYISEVYDFKIDIDHAAFMAKDATVDIGALPISLRKMRKVSISSILLMVLDQADATYELRKNRLVVIPLKTKQGLSARLPPPSTALLAKLRLPNLKRINFDANTPLIEGLSYLGDVYDLEFVIDDKAFRKADIQEAKYQPIRLSTPPSYSLSLTLKFLLQQLQATYRVHGEFILIVPGDSDYTLGEEIELERGRHIAFWSFIRASGEVLVERKLRTMRAEMTLGLLMASLKDRQPTVRAHAAGALGEKGVEARPAVSVLCSALKDSDEIVRGMVATALGKIGPADEPAIPALTEALKDKAFFVRRAAIVAVGQFGTEASAAVPALAEALKDDDWVVRGSAARVLGQLRATAKPAVRALAAALQEKHPGVREQVVLALRSIGPSAEEAIPALIRAMREKDETFRNQVYLTLRAIRGVEDLGSFGPGAVDAVPALIELLDDEQLAERYGIMNALVSIGAGAVPDLANALQHPNREVRLRAMEVLSRIGPDADGAVDELIEVAKGKDADLQFKAAAVLGKIGTPAMSSLLEMLEDKDAHRRAIAAVALGHAGKAARSAVPALTKALKDPEAQVRYRVAEAFWQIGPEVRLPYAELIEAFADSDVKMRDRVMEALARPDDRAIAALSAALKHKDPRVRRGVADSLGMIGPAAKAVVYKLHLARSDSDESVRQAADKAIQSIQKAKQ
jgi:HEAT repeat protein